MHGSKLLRNQTGVDRDHETSPRFNSLHDGRTFRCPELVHPIPRIPEEEKDGVLIEPFDAVQMRLVSRNLKRRKGIETLVECAHPQRITSKACVVSVHTSVGKPSIQNLKKSDDESDAE